MNTPMILPQLALAAVVRLTHDDFDSFIGGHDNVFVKFFAPWCGHCRALAPHYEEASNGVSTPFAEVDCTQDGDLCRKYNVNGYPTLKLFKGQVPVDYNGGRDAASMRAFIKRETVGTITTVRKEELKKDAKRRGLLVYFVLYCPTAQVAELSRRLEGYDVFFYHIDDPSIKLLVSREEYQYTLNAVDNDRQVAAFIRKYKNPFVPELNEPNFYELSNQPGKQLAILVPGHEDLEKLVELHQVNQPDYLRVMERFFFTKADVAFANKLVDGRLTTTGPALLFFNNRNQARPRYEVCEVNGGQNTTEQFLNCLQRFDPHQMHVLERNQKGQHTEKPDDRNSEYKKMVDDALEKFATKEDLEKARATLRARKSQHAKDEL